jgi:radical SAM superfamily enzyme YgiQ (UPF0313 family)
MDKGHNMMVPILEGVRTLNEFGMEVVSGIILGLDTDTPQAGVGVTTFAEQTNIPVLTINLLQALPRTKLWDRLVQEGRLIQDDEGLESNVVFRLPYGEVVEMWRECMAKAYAPDALFKRFEHQLAATYAKRLNPPRRVTPKLVLRGIGVIVRLLIMAGVLSPYRRAFWRFAWPLIRKGDIERVVAVGVVAHHLITFAAEAVSGRQNASFYSRKVRGVAADVQTAKAAA